MRSSILIRNNAPPLTKSLLLSRSLPHQNQTRLPITTKVSIPQPPPPPTTTAPKNASISTTTTTASASAANVDSNLTLNPDTLWSSSAWSPSAVRPYKDKSLGELLNSYTVFKMCEFPPLISITPAVLDAAEKTGTSALVNFGVKKTFFAHFCGGETISEVLPTMSKLKNRNMGSILDLAIEADMESEAEPTTTKAKETSSHILSLMKESVDIASENPGSFIAAKVTAYVPPAILLRWTNSLRLVQESFNAVKDATTQKTTRSALAQALSKVFPTMTATTHLSGLGATDSSPIDWIDVSNYFSFTNLKIRPAMFQVNSNSTTTNKLLQPITDAADFATLDAVFADLQALMAHADAKNVKVMVDAEQTYFQRAIDDIALTLSRTFNKKNNVVVFNTYQMYLKDGFQRLVTDWTRAHSRGDGNDGWSFGVKIVRGAYMTSERDRAKQLGYADPINATIADTHASYNAAIDFLLQRLAAAAAATANGDGGSEQKLEFVVASHNKASVAKTVAAMQKYGVAPGNPQISFAQLMGMQDGTSYALAANGYRCFKYVPYGPIEDTIPYLLRRAQENSSVLSGGAVEEDKKELVAEISRRAAASC